jgi:hypothetical protein
LLAYQPADVREGQIGGVKTAYVPKITYHRKTICHRKRPILPLKFDQSQRGIF